MELNNCFCFKKNTIPPLGEFGEVNCFIGKNDRGKSLALKIIDMVFNSIDSSVFEGIKTGGGEHNVSLNPIGRKLIYGDSDSTSSITLYLEIQNTSPFKEILDRLQSKFNNIHNYRSIKLDYKIESPEEGEGRFFLDKIFFGIDKNDEWIGVDNFGGESGGFRQTLYKSMSQNGFLLIPAIRSIKSEISQVVESGWSPKLDGAGLANAIFEYRNNLGLGKRTLIDQINTDMQQLTDFSSVSAYKNQNQRYIEYDEIPESFVGDATKQITVATFAIRSLKRKKIIGFEEPESHLHPGKQKEYLKFLLQTSKRSNTQLFITTHSPFFLNMFEIENIYRFYKDENENIQIDRCSSDEDLWLLLSQIGVKPSDYLQSDLILFTEGPSDKKILEIFSEKIGYDLREYSVCFTHLGSISKDLDIESLLRINRSYKLIIDSNLGSIQGEKATEDIRKLFEEAGELDRLKIWERREIENYLSPRAIEEYYGLSKDTIQIKKNTDVVSEIIEKLRQNGITRGFKKTKDGPKIAKLMDENEIVKEIHGFFKDAISK